MITSEEKKLNEADFKKAWDELAEEYENELQRLHAEIEQEKQNNSVENQKNTD